MTNPAAEANTISTFTILGVLSDGGTVSGSLNIDVTAGLFQTGNFTVIDGATGAIFTGNPFARQQDTSTTYFAQYSVNGAQPTNVGDKFFSVETPFGLAVGYYFGC